MMWTDRERVAFERYVLRTGVRPVARALGCGHQSIYRWMDGECAPDKRYRRSIADIMICSTRNARRD